MKNLMMVMMVLLIGLISACAAKPCNDLAKQVCAMASGTAACEKASRLTANDECRGFLKDVKHYVELTNLVVTTRGVQPPAPPPPPAPAPDAIQAPDVATPPAVVAQPVGTQSVKVVPAPTPAPAPAKPVK